MLMGRDPVLERALQIAGGPKLLAAALDCTPQAVSQWKRVPALRVLAIERITGIPREELRPDLHAEAA